METWKTPLKWMALTNRQNNTVTINYINGLCSMSFINFVAISDCCFLALVGSQKKQASRAHAALAVIATTPGC